MLSQEKQESKLHKTICKKLVTNNPNQTQLHFSQLKHLITTIKLPKPQQTQPKNIKNVKTKQDAHITLGYFNIAIHFNLYFFICYFFVE